MMKKYGFNLLCSLIGLLFLGGCGPEETNVLQFTLLGDSHTGIQFTNTIKDSKERTILRYANFYGGAGVGVGDFNNDGLPDLYFAGNTVPDELYINKGDFRFENTTEAAGIKDDGGWSTGVTIADVNNDGNLDIYVSRELYDDKPEWRTNLLYINQGDGTFKEEAEKYGVADSQRTRHATFLDYDKDGFLDLFLLTQPPNPGSYSELYGSELLLPEYHLKLLKNQGGKSFTDVSEASGIAQTGFPNAVSASDLNNDGWPDLYVANDFQAPDFLFINNQDGTFTNQAEQALNHMSFYSMGVDVADINNDNLLDVFVLDMVAEDNFRMKSNMSGMNPDSFWKVVADGGHYQYMYNSLQLNNGNTTFSDVAQITGMAATDWSWANLLADFDNDGLKDVFVTNGLLYDIRNTDADKKVERFISDTAYEWLQKHPDGGDKSIWDILDLEATIALMPSQPLKNYAFRNKGNLEFEKVMDDWGLDQESFSNGAAYADFDQDGDLDLVVNNINSKAFIYRNNAEQKPATNFIRITLKDSDNRPVFGSRVTVIADGKQQLSELTNVRGIYSTSESLLHFGLGDANTIDSILVSWPDGSYTVLRDQDANQTLELDMSEAGGRQLGSGQDSAPSPFTLLNKQAPLEFVHRETAYDDYQHQVLLPHKMSEMGPAMAKADVNNDGLEDIYLGGSGGFASSLKLQQEDGTFINASPDLWEKEEAFEDVDALFVDVNLDGLPDLYVVSGGNEYPAGDVHYTDRLYLNQGEGKFIKGAILNVNRASGSVVKAFDYDGDGDEDLFVGGRHLPHQYPLPAGSMILINNNGSLVNLTSDLAPELDTLGMVTDASWVDYDSDGDTDLLLVGEWMPVTVMDNHDGRLTKTEVKGLEQSHGWWYSIGEGDFDQDGDTDFLLGNLGLNYKYKTSPETPFDIYYNDFDKNGNYDIVLGYYNDQKHYPLRGFSCSSEQIPGLKDKIGKYDLFASLEIDQVYGKENLEDALHYTADTFASSYLENTGDGFVLKPLPRLAQLSSIQDFLVKDFNGDGFPDALAVGNMFQSEIETPRNDAGTGCLLLGDGKGNFNLRPGRETGFLARKDARKIRDIKIGEQLYFAVANNNDSLQLFRY